MASWNKDLFWILSRSSVAGLLARNKKRTAPGIYPVVLPQNADLPAIVTRVVTGDSENDLGGDSGFGHTTVQVNVISDSVDRSDDLIERVRQVLAAYRGKPSTRFICGIRSLNPVQTPVPPRNASDGWRFVSSRDFEISHQQVPVLSHS